MPFRIQRVPQGLLNLLSIAGGATPIELEDRVQAVLEIIQLYGLQQRRVLLATNAALASGGAIDLRSNVANVPVTEGWAVLFGATAGIIKVAATTDASLSLELSRVGSSTNIALAVANSQQLGAYGAAGLGSAGIAWTAPFPYILPPTWNISARLQNLAGVANASVSVIAEIGVLQ